MKHPYETLAYVARLSFRDAHGLEAVFDWYQRIRVLTPGLRFVLQEIWGGGDQLKDYVSTSADPIHHARLNGRDIVVSKLKQPANVGDEIELYSTRRIHHAFKDGDRFYWEYTPITPTRRARVAIDFPLGREPSQLQVAASPASRSPQVTRPGTMQLITTVDHPTLRSLYRIDWRG